MVLKEKKIEMKAFQSTKEKRAATSNVNAYQLGNGELKTFADIQLVEVCLLH